MITTKDISSIGKGHVLDTDGGKIGSVGQIFLDNTTGEPAWVTVHTGLFGTKHSFVPLSAATVSGGDVRVPFDKAKVKDAPRVEADGELTPAEEEELYRYYGLHGDDRGRDGQGRDQRAADDRGHDAQDHDAQDHDAQDHDGGAVDRDLNSHGMVDAQVAATAASVAGHTGRGEGHDTSANDAAAHDSSAHDTAAHDTAAHDTAAAQTRSQDQPHPGTRTEQAGRTRIRRYVVTEEQTITVPVTHEEFVVEHEPTAQDARTSEADETTGRHSDQR